MPKRLEDNKITIYTDGGARGNPGPAAVGVVLVIPGHEKKTFQEYIGETTNNVAEYKALILALKKLKSLIGGEKIQQFSGIECYADSELMVRQLSGEYKIKEPEIQTLFVEVWNLNIDLIIPMSFHHIERAKNAEADALVNAALDREANKLDL